MKRDDMKGAIAAAKYYTQLFVYMNATNETSAAEKMSLPDCGACSHWINSAKERERTGRIRVNLSVEITKTEHDTTWNNGREIFIVRQRTIFAPWQEYDRDGKLVEEAENSSPGYITYNLYREGTTWAVYKIIPESDADFAAEIDDE